MTDTETYEDAIRVLDREIQKRGHPQDDFLRFAQRRLLVADGREAEVRVTGERKGGRLTGDAYYKEIPPYDP